MKIVRFVWQDQARYGLIENEVVYALQGQPWDAPERAAKVGPLSEVRLLAPCMPTKIVAVGRNYLEHAAEMQSEAPAEPLLFLKPPSAVIGPQQAIHYPALSQRVDHEAELAVIIGRRAKDVPVSQALQHVLGYTCGNDVTARDLQRQDGQWTRGKGFDTFCPLGPWIVTDLPPDDLGIESRVNGQVRQQARTSQMIFPIAELIRYITQVMTLEPGDVILTGTPAGVGPLQRGDRVEVEIEGLGVLINPVV